MRTNQTKAKLKSGQTVIGCFVRYADPGLIDFLGYQGWDFIVFDGEHGTIEPRDCENMVRAAEVHDVTPIIRVNSNQPPIILRYLDTGAQGLHVPWVNSAQEAEQVISSVKYYPRGIRGLASVRAADYGQTVPLGEYTQKANSETLVVIHIETAEAVDRLPEILGVDGIDVVFIGPTDLSQSYGVPGQADHPTVRAAIQRIVDAAAASNVAIGTLTTSIQAAQEWQRRGARYITITVEALLRQTARGFVDGVRNPPA